MDEFSSNLSEGQEGVVDPQENTNIPEGGSEPIDSQSNARPTQDKETNSAFAEMRRRTEDAEKRASQIERDYGYFQKYSDLGVRNEAELREAYGNQGINSWEDVDRYYEAQEKNIDPEVYRRLTDAEVKSQEALEKLGKYERKELIDKQMGELSSDNRWGSFFNANKDEILNVANQFSVDLQTAKLLVMEAKYQEPNLDEVKQNAVKEYIEKLKTGGAPVLTSGSNAVVVNSAPKTFEEARKSAMNYIKNLKG